MSAVRGLKSDGLHAKTRASVRVRSSAGGSAASVEGIVASVQAVKKFRV
jgi:hypothetical protein